MRLNDCGCHCTPTTFKCGGCGQQYHISLFREALRATAEEAYRLGRMSKEEAIDAAIYAGYAVGGVGEEVKE